MGGGGGGGGGVGRGGCASVGGGVGGGGVGLCGVAAAARAAATAPGLRLFSSWARSWMLVWLCSPPPRRVCVCVSAKGVSIK